MFFPMAVIALDLGNVLLFLFGNNIDTRSRRVGVMTLSLSSTAPGTLLVLLVILWVGGGGLLGSRLLFPTRYVSRGEVSGLIHSRVLFLFFRGLVPSRISWVHISGAGRWLKHHLCLCIDGFFHGLFSGVQVSASGIYSAPDGRSQAFQKALDHDLLVWSCSGIKLLVNRLQVLQVGCPVGAGSLSWSFPNRYPQRLVRHLGFVKRTPWTRLTWPG